MGQFHDSGLSRLSGLSRRSGRLVYLISFHEIDKIDISHQTDRFRYSFALSLTVHRKPIAQQRLHRGGKRYDLAIRHLALSECRTVPRRLLEIRQ